MKLADKIILITDFLQSPDEQGKIEVRSVGGHAVHIGDIYLPDQPLQAKILG